MVRPHPALIEIAALRPIPNVSDYEELTRTAVEHRMTGLLFREIEAHRITGPSEWMRQIAALHLKSAAQSLRQATAAASILEALGTIGAEGALFKGVAAEARWYTGVGDRPSGDVDILIHPQHWHLASEILAIINPEDPLQRHARYLVERGIVQSINTRHHSGAWVDIHFDPFKIGRSVRDINAIWERTVQVTLPGGVACLALDSEMSLIQFSAHLNRDKFAYLLGHADIARILASAHIDWDFVDAFVHREGLKTHIYLSLDTVLTTLALPPIEGPPAIAGWRARVWRVVWPDRIRLRGDESMYRWRRRHHLLPLLTEGRRRDMVGRWWYSLFPPPELVSRYYHRSEGFYLYRLFAARGQKMWRRLRKS